MPPPIYNLAKSLFKPTTPFRRWALRRAKNTVLLGIFEFYKAIRKVIGVANCKNAYKITKQVKFVRNPVNISDVIIDGKNAAIRIKDNKKAPEDLVAKIETFLTLSSGKKIRTTREVIE